MSKTSKNRERIQHLMRGLGGLSDVVRRMQARKEKKSG